MKSFFCQYCNHNVPINAKQCPNCKKEFDSVMCPKCFFKGNHNLFLNGCPSCGYLREKKIPSTKNHTKGLKLSIFIILLSSLIGIIIFFLSKLVE